ncbi:MAG: hypothetical protein IT379_20780, partial [Deltaproteobacteria bacterium]|nr:hypothetical protein [Deltaproteobacteria bacterium]
MTLAHRLDASARRRVAFGLALAAAVVVSYAGSLSGGFLNYDDDWLIERNPVLADPSPAALATIWTDLSR